MQTPRETGATRTKAKTGQNRATDRSQRTTATMRQKGVNTLGMIDVPLRQMNMNALRFCFRGLDIFCITTIIALVTWNGYIGTNGRDILAPIVVAAFGSVLFAVLLKYCKAYEFSPSETLTRHMRTVYIASLAALGLWLMTALISRPETFSPNVIATAGVCAVAVIAVLHSIYHSVTTKLHAKNALVPTVALVGANATARRIIEDNLRSQDMNIIAVFDDRIDGSPDSIHGVPVIAMLEDLVEWEHLPFINRLIVTLPQDGGVRAQDYLERVELLPNRVAIAIDPFEDGTPYPGAHNGSAEITYLEVSGEPKSGKHTALKRILDIVIGSAALVMLMPILAVIGLLIKLDSKGPVLFAQNRTGYNNRVFKVYKFRSMVQDQKDLASVTQVTKNDMRVTKIGKILRNTSLDELPQLINVIKGDMSLVGPRPHPVKLTTNGQSSRELVELYMHRYKVKPGMTGWAQINGSRGPMLSADHVQRRIDLDREYIERSSILWDIYIMIKTLPVLLGDAQNVR